MIVGLPVAKLMTDAAVPCRSIRCTACCRGDLIFILPDQGDRASDYQTATIADHYPDAPPELAAAVVLAQRENGECVYLGDDGCTIHDRAPAICRVFDCRKAVPHADKIGAPVADGVRAAARKLDILARKKRKVMA